METNIKTNKDKIINIVLWSLISLLILFIIMVLYIPKLSMKVIKTSGYQALTGVDSTLGKYDILFVTQKPFDDLVPGDIIVFKLEGYGNSDGLKAYSVMAQPDPDYYHVRTTGSAISFPWNITEEMYIGIVSARVPYIGAVTGFLGSIYGIGILIINGLVIGGIIYLVKQNKKDENNEAA